MSQNDYANQWQPDPELSALWAFCRQSGVPSSLRQALLLRIALSDNYAAAVKAVEMLGGFGASADLSTGNISPEDARRVAQLAERFLNDDSLSIILDGVSLAEGYATSDPSDGPKVPAWLRKNDVSGVQIRSSQSADDGGADDGSHGTNQAIDYYDAAETWED